MTGALDTARAALRQRQGSGARYDAAAAPARELDWARRGTAYFARLLNGLSDADLDGPAVQAGLTRRHVVARVGYEARLLSEIVAWCRAGQGEPFPKALELPEVAVEQGHTLPARALRYLFEHAAVHLNVEWRDLTGQGWDAVAASIDGQRLPLRETPIIRARSLWLGALNLNAGARRSEMPRDLVDRLSNG